MYLQVGLMEREQAAAQHAALNRHHDLLQQQMQQDTHHMKLALQEQQEHAAQAALRAQVYRVPTYTHIWGAKLYAHIECENTHTYRLWKYSHDIMH